jgi:hypothetical protein
VADTAKTVAGKAVDVSDTVLIQKPGSKVCWMRCPSFGCAQLAKQVVDLGFVSLPLGTCVALAGRRNLADLYVMP